MATPTSLFDYVLPKERIAQHPANPRESARLLVLSRVGGERFHEHVADLPTHVRPGDVWVFNNTKVFKARLFGKHKERTHEVLLLRPVEVKGRDSVWEALVHKSNKLRKGDVLKFGFASARVWRKGEEMLTLLFDRSEAEVFALCEELGEVPTPPYVEEKATLSEYQTVYAKHVGSVAAPTAGFHFTQELLKKMEEAGATIAYVTLHVGIGTFRPVRTETLEEHAMHEEWAEVPEETARIISAAKARGSRVVAVGTTTVRTLEGVAAREGSVKAFSGFLNLFITPGFPFQVIDALLTNFHLPKSTLLALVSSFASREHILAAYQEAIEREYRFYSFGDAMLIE